MTEISNDTSSWKIENTSTSDFYGDSLNIFTELAEVMGYKMDKYNEYQEALDYVNKSVNRALVCLNIKPESELPKSLHKLQELVNKETPKKVLLPIGTFNFHCPSCGGYSAAFQGQHYCLYCGQKLDWSENDG